MYVCIYIYIYVRNGGVGTWRRVGVERRVTKHPATPPCEPGVGGVVGERMCEVSELLTQLTGLLRLLTGLVPEVTGLLRCPELPGAHGVRALRVWGVGFRV